MKKKKRGWMNDVILSKMEQRKNVKNKTTEYNVINKEIVNECRQAKENWLNEQCEEIESLEKQHKTKEMYGKVKELTKKCTLKGGGSITDKNGKILFDQEEIDKRWVEYIKELYDDDRAPMPQFEITSGQSILKEVEKTIQSMKKGKATGSDEISTEMLRALDDENIDVITNLCNIMYNSGVIPTDLKQSIFITLPKKSKAQSCTEYRTISLMSHVTKLLLKVIEQRIVKKIDNEVSRLQSGFRTGSGTREGIFNLRTVCKQAIDLGKDVYICFIDYTKAFDRVKHSKIIECLSEIGIDDKDLQIITKMYWEQTAVVRTEHDITEEFQVKKGVRQGCVLSPSLFNLYTEKIFREIEDMEGVNVGGHIINNLRYADDTSLLALEEQKLQNLLNTVNDKGKLYGMEINVKKTKSMVASKKQETPKVSINLDGTAIEQVEKMVYLGSITTEDGKSEMEIKRRIEIARNAFNNIKSILSSRNISLNTRMRLTKCYVWSSLLYGAETWTVTKTLTKRIDTFEMWTYR